MTTAVLGHFVLDEIHTLDGNVHETLGGIAFPLYAFQAIVGKGDVIYPVFPLGYDAVDAFREAFPPSPEFHHTYVYPVQEANTRVRLYHETLAHYNTRLVASLDTIPLERILPALTTADLLYINMMTGKDIVPDTISRIREEFSGSIYMDLHMIAYETHAGGARVPAHVRNWKEWVQHVDILQCNELECEAFIAGFASETERIHAIMDVGVTRVVVITRGTEGVTLYFRDGTIMSVPAVSQPNVVDPTGCGDVFGSVFAYLYTLKKDVAGAAHVAAHAASFVAGVPGSRGIAGLRSYLDTI